MFFVPRICDERAGTPLQLLSKLTGTRLLILGAILVAIAALIEVSKLLRARAARLALAPTPIENAYVPVMPPARARDPFLSAPPKPPAIVAPRPNVRGEAAIATLAVGAYVAVFAMSAFGGDQAPDLLSIRADRDTSPVPAFAAEVLSAQSSPEPPATVTETVTPSATPEPTPTPVPEPTEVPGRPAQHVLRSGETLTSVAALYGTTAYDLAVANGLTADLIYAGQVLKIPAR